MACVGTNGKGNRVKYGEKRDEKVNSEKCKGLWDKLSYQCGNVGVCQLKCDRRGRIDFYGRVHVPKTQTIAQACQKAYPLTAQKM